MKAKVVFVAIQTKNLCKRRFIVNADLSSFLPHPFGA